MASVLLPFVRGMNNALDLAIVDLNISDHYIDITSEKCLAQFVIAH